MRSVESTPHQSKIAANCWRLAHPHAVGPDGDERREVKPRPGDTPRPHTLRELRVSLVGGDELASALAPVGRVEPLHPGDQPGGDGSPAFLLVENGAGVEEGWTDELDRLLDTCERNTIPSLLWVTSTPLDPYWLDRCARFDRVFTVDRGQIEELEAAGARTPVALWPATALRIDERTTGSPARRDAVVWIGGWRREWPAAWRDRLESVLCGAARRGLKIIDYGEIEALPSSLRPHVVATESGEGPEAALRHAKVVVGADPRYGSALLAPRVVFDAAAAGAAVITPHDFASLHDFAIGGTREIAWRNLIPVVHDSEIATQEIDQLLDDEQLRREIACHTRRIVANNHTYAHRLATLASAAGYRLVPNADDPAPA
jgi:Glycosyl transferases group 1